MTQDRRVAVIGLGYVGLPLAISFVEAGLTVEGIDAYPPRVAELNAGSSPIDDVSNERLAAALASGLSVVAPSDASIPDADAIFVCVPTPITTTKDPDLQPVLSAAETIRGHLRAGQLVILQSTTFPGTTTGPFREVLERTGLRAGTDFDLAFAPERVNPGDPASASKGVPRLVGATTEAGTERAAALLRNINEQVVTMSSPDAAELSKLLENVFRNVNIAFVNNLALLCERMGLDVWEVINAAATKPFGFMKFTPGPGVGGHCIPVDPYYLAWRAREFDFIDRFIELAGDINFAMPRHVVDLVAEALNDRGKALKGAKVGVLGVAFKPNVRDARNSPAADVIAGIAGRGADVRFHDPHVPTFKDAQAVIRENTELDELLDWADVIVIVTAHASIDWAQHVRACRTHRGHRGLLARPDDPVAPGPSSRRRMVGGQLTAPVGRVGRAPRPVLMIVHSYYDEDPRVRREAEAVVASGRPVLVLGLRRPGEPADGELAGVRIRRLDVQRHQGASLSRTSPSTATSSFEPAGRPSRPIVASGSPWPRSRRCPDYLVFATVPLKLVGVPVVLDLHEAMPEFFRSRFPKASNPIAHRLLLLQERLSIAFSTATLVVNEAMRDRLSALASALTRSRSSSTARRSSASIRGASRGGHSALTARCASSIPAA